MDGFAAYGDAFLALGLYGLLYLVQLVSADLIGIRRKHVPGTPVTSGHDDLLFRATRAHANTTESVGALILIALFAIGVGATPSRVALGLEAFLALRVVHMLAYYFDQRMARSIAFGLSLLALAFVFFEGVVAL